MNEAWQRWRALLRQLATTCGVPLPPDERAKRIAAIREEMAEVEPDLSDIPEAGDEWFSKAKLRGPR